MAEAQTISSNRKQVKFKVSRKTVNILIFITLAVILLAQCAFNTFRNGKDIEFIGSANNDLYYMIPTGKDIVQNGIPKWNTFSYVQGQRIVVQQWAYCVLVYLFYSLFKDFGIFMFVILNSLLFVISGAWYLKEKGVGWTAALQVSCIIVSAFIYLGTRPQSLTMALLCIQCAATERYIKGRNKKWLFLIPLCTLLEMNFHGSMALLHLILILPYTQKKPKNTKFKKLYEEVIPWNDLWLPLLLSIVSLFVNPYGIDGITYLIKSLGILNNSGLARTITEMNPPAMGTSLMLIWTAVLVTALLEMVYVSKLSIADLYIAIGLIGISVQPTRNTMFLYPAIYLLISQLVNIPALHDWIASIFENGVAQIFESKLGVAALAVITLLFGYRFSECVPMIYNQAISHPPDSFITPVKGLEYISKKNDNRNDIKIMSYMCSYPEFEGYKVLVDSRPEIYQKKLNHVDDIASDLATVMLPGEMNFDGNYEKYYNKIIKKYDPDYVIVTSDFPEEIAFMESMNHNENYKKTFKSSNYILYEKYEKNVD